MASRHSWTSSASPGQEDVERLLERLRRLVRERRELEEQAVDSAALEANRDETERVRGKVAAAVKLNVPGAR
jgi:hypothetical protein